MNLEDNSSANAFLEHLKENHIVVDMSDYGGFEKVEDLGFNLQKNDININATSGYVILQIYKAKKYPINFNRVLFYIKLIFYFIGI
ncbi:MAG: hypothetical protein IAC55_02530 [Tyzzerella sp.]|uniref:Cyclophilin-like domain-containing protein n=1 Tax=Candidatus Fimicola merdigallinarum TaxID=2840819 RepID=A0A9D9DWE0_9FIRM|nr:hypothetical protein [Candidatus Fimicola merdigallinarum]